MFVSYFSESSIRGVLVSVGSFSTTIGPLIVFFLGTLIEWRTVALIFCAIQIITLIALLFVSVYRFALRNVFIFTTEFDDLFETLRKHDFTQQMTKICFHIRETWNLNRSIVCIFQIPESPIWLMTKNREDDALISLKWLRGWQTNDSITNEFNDIKRYKEFSNACPVCRKTQVRCTHPPTTVTQNLRELIKRKSIKPFSILVTCCFFGFACGTHHLLSFVVQILNTFRSPIDANWATVCWSIFLINFTSLCRFSWIPIDFHHIFLYVSTGGCWFHSGMWNILQCDSTSNHWQTKIISYLNGWCCCINVRIV